MKELLASSLFGSPLGLCCQGPYLSPMKNQGQAINVCLACERENRNSFPIRTAAQSHAELYQFTVCS